MRLALSGTHAVGKSTLIAELHRELPAYAVVDEPYHELLDEGHEFADRPSVDDFLVQLERSIARLTSHFLLEDDYGLSPSAVSVHGSPIERARQVVTAIQRR